MTDGILHIDAALHLTDQQRRDGYILRLHIAQAVEHHRDSRFLEVYRSEAHFQRIPGRGHQRRVERPADLQGQAAPRPLLLRLSRRPLHSGGIASDHKLSRAVVVCDDRAAHTGRLPADLLQRFALHSQHRNHGGGASGGGFLHGFATEGRQRHGGVGVKHTCGVKRGIFSQRKTRSNGGNDAPLRQRRCHTGGKGHHARLSIPGSVQNAVFICKGNFL